MVEFDAYNDELKSAFADALSSGQFINDNKILSTEYINSKLRLHTDMKLLRDSGAFFTDDALSDELMKNVTLESSKCIKIVDIACGAGSLLVSATKHLPVEDTLTATLSSWGKQLFGFDLHLSFVTATKLRIIFEAISRGCQIDESNLEVLMSLLPNILVGDGLKSKNIVAVATHVLLNPPFTQRTIENNDWASGKVTEAAIFVDYVQSHLAQGAKLLSILPDVLRSGARYSKWRDKVSKNINFSTAVVGRFDDKTDVDVFLLYGEKSANAKILKHASWIYGSDSNEPNIIISDHFDVSVGTVVPHRDLEEGILYPYLFPKVIENWESIKTFDHHRMYGGKVHSGPFVIIKRTSSPSDKHRASAAIVAFKGKVAIENHLIVVKPKDGTLRWCKKLLKLLEHTETNNFLNQRIRCRHLTVASVKEIPLRW